MDKVTCIAYLLYHSSKNQDIKEKAIQLLNGDVSLVELKRNSSFQEQLVFAETLFRRDKVDKIKVQQFVQEYMLVEI